MPRISIIFIVFGIIYLIKPDIFKWGIMWERLSRKNFFIYMRLLGLGFIIAGVIIWICKR